jgi:hypothetical protein
MDTSHHIPEPVVIMDDNSIALTGVNANDSERNPRPSNSTYLPLHNEDLMIEILDVSPEQFEDNACVICLTNPKNSVFYPCGHQCLC